MNGLISTTNDPAFNLATEEYLLRHSTKDAFFLYTNSPSIIVGKHQNTLSEINYRFVNDKHIPVYRRLSGGGTVYHDNHNLNFCFIQTGKKGELVNFAKYSEPILLALKSLGVNATFGKRHDIQIDGKKVSGNASHVYKSRVMHHGTLLFSSDLDVLNKSLKNNPLIIKDKAVKSVRSEVTNISKYLDASFTYENFVEYIFKELLSYYNNASTLQLTNDERYKIKVLSAEKYNTWEWNYGYSPNFELNKRYKLKNGTRVNSQIKIEKGLITKCDLKTSDGALEKLTMQISKSVLRVQHDKNTLKDILYKLKFDHHWREMISEIIDGFFS